MNKPKLPKNYQKIADTISETYTDAAALIATIKQLMELASKLARKGPLARLKDGAPETVRATTLVDAYDAGYVHAMIDFANGLCGDFSTLEATMNEPIELALDPTTSADLVDQLLLDAPAPEC